LRLSTGSLAAVYFVVLLSTLLISGGHLNPAITLAVWIEQKNFMANGLFMLGTLIVQVLGAIFALPLCYVIRIVLFTDSFRND